VSGGISEVLFGREGGGVGNCPFEESFSLGRALEVDQNAGVVVEEDRVLPGGSYEFGVERSGLIVLLIIGVETGEEAGYCRVVRVGGMELFEYGKGLGGLVLLLVEGGELSIEGGVIGVFG
jgi:hypothetical protein